MKVKIRFASIYALVMAIVIVSRSYRELVFPSITIEIYVIVIATLLGLIGIVKAKDTIDILWILMPIIYMVNRDESYQILLLVIALGGFFARYILRKRVETVQIVLRVVLIFSLFTSVITWVSILNQELYTSVFVPMLDSSSKIEILRQLNDGNLCGFTTHYSRNAFYVLSGMMIIISKLWGKEKQKNRKILYTGLLFETVTLLSIGKRGHLIFGIIALYIVYMIMQKNVSEKLKKTIKFVVVIFVIGVFFLYLFPESRHTFERFFFEAEAGDPSTGRFANYRMAITVFKNHPIFGIGIGGFRSLTNNVYAGVHNDYLQYLCETGIVGFVCFVGLQVYSLVEAVCLLRQTYSSSVLNSQMRALLIWATIFQFFIFLYAFTGLPHFDYEVNTLYLISCAVPVGVRYQMKKGTSDAKDRNCDIIR